MKKWILYLACILAISCAQASGNSTDKPYETVYRLYPTQNIRTFIKLDTRNGKMWQVQFALNGDNRFEVYLNMLPLAKVHEEVAERFELYPTQNIYNFILLDRVDGRTWQVQWSTKSENRGIIPIQ